MRCHWRPFSFRLFPCFPLIFSRSREGLPLHERARKRTRALFSRRLAYKHRVATKGEAFGGVPGETFVLEAPGSGPAMKGVFLEGGVRARHARLVCPPASPQKIAPGETPGNPGRKTAHFNPLSRWNQERHENRGNRGNRENRMETRWIS